MRYNVRISQIEGRLKVSRRYLLALSAGDYTVGGKQVTIQRQEQGMVVVAINDGGRFYRCSFR